MNLPKKVELIEVCPRDGFPISKLRVDVIN